MGFIIGIEIKSQSASFIGALFLCIVYLKNVQHTSWLMSRYVHFPQFRKLHCGLIKFNPSWYKNSFSAVPIYGNEKEAIPIVTGTASYFIFNQKRLNYILGLWITSFHPYRHPFRPEAS